MLSISIGDCVFLQKKKKDFVWIGLDSIPYKTKKMTKDNDFTIVD